MFKIYEIKIVNSITYDDQLDLTRSSLKNKLFETTKESEEFKFQQHLQVEFT